MLNLLLLAPLVLASAAFPPATYDRFGLLVTSVALNPLPELFSLWVNQTIDLRGVHPSHRCSLEMLGILVTAPSLSLAANLIPLSVAGTRFL